MPHRRENCQAINASSPGLHSKSSRFSRSSDPLTFKRWILFLHTGQQLRAFHHLAVLSRERLQAVASRRNLPTPTTIHRRQTSETAQLASSPGRYRAVTRSVPTSRLLIFSTDRTAGRFPFSSCAFFGTKPRWLPQSSWISHRCRSSSSKSTIYLSPGFPNLPAQLSKLGSAFPSGTSSYCAIWPTSSTQR